MAESLGKQLKQIREERGISLEEISLKTKISLKYLEALEWDESESLPSKTAMRGFLRLYASELGVNINDLEGEEQKFSQTTLEKDQEVKTDDLSPSLIRSPDAVHNAKKTEQTDRKETSEPKKTVSPLDPQEEYTEPKISQEISNQFKSIGEKIRERRELLSLSLDNIEDNLHIRRSYLIAIESGNFDQLPSPVQAKGMLANYVSYLNLDADQILLEYADSLQQRRSYSQQQGRLSKKAGAKQLSSTRLKLKNFFSLDLLVIGLLILAFGGFVIWGVNRILSVNSTGNEISDIPEVSEILLATGSPTAQEEITPDVTTTPEPQEEEIVQEQSLLFTPLPNENPINIVIIPRQRVWVQVTTDSEINYEGRLITGNAYEYAAKDTLEILTGNAGALQIYFNDQDIGSPGLNGQVLTLVFTREGLVLPTPTNTPTITETPENSATPTITPSPTATP
jgi:cytoskeletal protein RodZ